jgi:hypothetical protein
MNTRDYIRWMLGPEWALAITVNDEYDDDDGKVDTKARNGCVITIMISTEVMARWTLGPEWVLVIAISERVLLRYHGKVDTRPGMGSSFYSEPLLWTLCT